MALSNLGLIQMGGAMLRPGGSLGDGFLAYGDGLVRDDHMKSTALYRNAQMESLQSQAQERQMKILAAKQQRENMEKFMASLQAPSAAAPNAPPAPSPVSSQSGLNGPLGSGTFGLDPVALMAERGLQTPAQASVAPQGQPGKWDELKFLMGMQAGLKREDIEALANARNLGIPEVARTIEQADTMGNPQTMQFDKFGRPVGSPINKPVELDLKDLGGQFQRYNKYTGGLVGNMVPKTATIGERETARHNSVSEGLRRQEVDMGGKPPPGYRWNGPRLEAIPGGPGDPTSKPLTDGQAQAAGYADRMLSAEDLMGGIAGGRATDKTRIAKSLPFVGDRAERAVMTVEQQKVKQAEDDWIRAKLRKESGAVIGADEMEQERITYFPQPGDSNEVIQQKAAARQLAIGAMGRMAGPAFKPTPTAPRPDSPQQKSGQIGVPSADKVEEEMRRRGLL